jgi:hypothetical protein
MASIFAGTMFLGNKGDDVSNNEANQIQQEYQAHLASVSNIELDRVTEEETPAAIESMNLTEEKEKQLTAQVKEKKVVLAWVVLWDTHRADGDRVIVRSDNTEQEVLLTKKYKKVAIPMPSSGKIEIQGLKDGGGGITVGIVTGKTFLRIPQLRETQPISVPVSRI